MNFKQFLKESIYNLAGEFIIRCWGQTLYLGYLQLPSGRNMIHDKEFLDLAEEYINAISNNKELDDWISEGAPMGKNYLVNKDTVDAALHSCETKLDKNLTLYRFDHMDNPLVAHSWLSLTIDPDGYPGKRTTFILPVGTKVIDTKNFADDGEYIVRTNELMKITGQLPRLSGF